MWFAPSRIITYMCNRKTTFCEGSSQAVQQDKPQNAQTTKIQGRLTNRIVRKTALLMMKSVLQVPILRSLTKLRANRREGLKYIAGEVCMSQVVMLHGREVEEILRTATQRKVPAIMSYLSKDKWHVAKVVLTDIGFNRLSVESYYPAESSHPINIRINQPVGISFKYTYGKFVFDTTVVSLEPSAELTKGGTIILALPDRIEVVQRRSYFRVNVPESLKVNVVLWHRTHNRQVKDNVHEYYQGRLVDISAGGAQVAVPCQTEPEKDCVDGKSTNFKKGQFIGLRFTPMPYETPLMFNAQIRTILPTADDKNLCLGLQIVGLEASPEGRQILSRITEIVERYYRINQSGAKQQDMQSKIMPERSALGQRDGITESAMN